MIVFDEVPPFHDAVYERLLISQKKRIERLDAGLAADNRKVRDWYDCSPQSNYFYDYFLISSMDIVKQRKLLIKHILSGERDEAMELLENRAERFLWRKTISELLEPVLEEIGKRWAKEKISLAAGYLAGKIAEEVLKRADETNEAIPQTKGPVVIGNAEDDYHALGKKLVILFLRTAGWKVIDLGNDVLAADFVSAAIENKAKIIGVSAMMLTTAENIIKIRREMERCGVAGKIKLAVGGAIFKVRPELVVEVGGDGTVSSAVDAPHLMERLLRQ